MIGTAAVSHGATPDCQADFAATVMTIMPLQFGRVGLSRTRPDYFACFLAL
jgi:hypothetical protein